MEFGGNVVIPWLVGGNFNVVMYLYERIGCSSNNSLAMLEFNAFIVVVGLQDAGYSRSKFAWCRKVHGLTKKFARLDIIFTNASWISSMPILEVKHLIKANLDHSPILIQPLGVHQSYIGLLHFDSERYGTLTRVSLGL